MGLLDFIFGKDPEWVEVSKDTFSTEDTYIYSKGESKKLLKLYLVKLGFSKEDIRDEVELYTEAMQDDEESIKEDISYDKEELKNATTKLNKFNKTKKNDEGKELSGEELQEYLEELELNIKFCEEDLTDQQKEKEKFKSDGWKPYLIKYINVYRSPTIKPKKLFFLHLLQTAGRKVGFMKKHKKTKRDDEHE